MRTPPRTSVEATEIRRSACWPKHRFSSRSIECIAQEYGCNFARQQSDASDEALCQSQRKKERNERQGDGDASTGSTHGCIDSCKWLSAAKLLDLGKLIPLTGAQLSNGTETDLWRCWISYFALGLWPTPIPATEPKKTDLTSPTTALTPGRRPAHGMCLSNYVVLQVCCCCSRKR